MKECVTHHYACDCREEAHRKEVARLTRERDKRFWKVCESEYPEEGWTVLEAATAEEAQRQYESSCGGRPDGVEPDEEWLTATPFTLEDLEAMDAENERLRGALRLAEGPIAIAASYADQPCETMGMRAHAKDCARVLPEIRAALAGEGEVGACVPTCRTVTQRVNSDWCPWCRRETESRAETEALPFCACGRRLSECDGSRKGCGKTPEKAREA